MEMMMMKMTPHLPAEVEVESSLQDYYIIMFLCVSHDDFIHDVLYMAPLLPAVVEVGRKKRSPLWEDPRPHQY